MQPVEYVFHIDAFRPETLPMARLAEYLAELATMFGHKDHTHFRAVEKGSVRALIDVDEVDAPKVQARLWAVVGSSAPKEALKAKQALEDMLANDNAIATLTEAGTERVVIPFVGRNRPKTLTFPGFREDVEIEGQIVAIGGRDTTAHATLQDGDVFHTNLSMSRAIARDLAPKLYGPTIRLNGSGRFERSADGKWRMTDFKVKGWEQISDQAAVEVLETIRALPGNRLMEPSAYQDVAGLFGSEDAAE